MTRKMKSQPNDQANIPRRAEDTQSGVMGSRTGFLPRSRRSTRGLPKPSPKISRAGARLSLSRCGCTIAGDPWSAPCGHAHWPPKQKTVCACSSRKAKFYRSHPSVQLYARAEVNQDRSKRAPAAQGRNEANWIIFEVSLRKKRITRTNTSPTYIDRPGGLPDRKAALQRGKSNTQRGQRTTELAIHAKHRPCQKVQGIVLVWPSTAIRMKHSGFRRPGQQLSPRERLEL